MARGKVTLLIEGELDLAYIAGFFDGEGCVVINKYIHTNGKEYSQMRVIISNTNLEVLTQIQARFGGAILSKNVSGNHKRGYELRLLSWSGANILKFMLPYLIVKSKQARVGIEFQNTMDGYCGNQYKTKLPDEVIEVRAKLRQRLMLLNVKGTGGT